MNKQVFMTPAKRRICELDAKTIAYFRRNPLLACEEILGIQLLDSQKYILQNTWNASHAVWCCSRNFGKSFLLAVLILLKAILYENQSIYIVSSVGKQSRETFQKMETLVTGSGGAAASIQSLKDIAANETVKTPTNKTGFSHNPEAYAVKFYNGSTIKTVNGRVDSLRGNRASLIAYDEAAFCSVEMLITSSAYATQNTEFVTSTDDTYNPNLAPRKCPTQLIYASSQDTTDKLFYTYYRNLLNVCYLGIAIISYAT